jgi:hypothetical protein
MANDPLLGEWEPDLRKSILGPGSPKKHTRRYEAVGAGHRVSAAGVDARGKKFAWEYTADYDGRPQPVKGWRGVDTVEVKRIDDRTTEGVFRKRGKITAFYRREIQAGELTVITAGADNGKGRPFFDVTVYRRKA